MSRTVELVDGSGDLKDDQTLTSNFGFARQKYKRNSWSVQSEQSREVKLRGGLSVASNNQEKSDLESVRNPISTIKYF